MAHHRWFHKEPSMVAHHRGSFGKMALWWLTMGSFGKRPPPWHSTGGFEMCVQWMAETTIMSTHELNSVFDPTSSEKRILHQAKYAL